MKWDYVEKYVYGSRSKTILSTFNAFKWHTELAENFKGPKSTTPKKAAFDIINWTITFPTKMISRRLI
jgi:hypothetical protein